MNLVQKLEQLLSSKRPNNKDFLPPGINGAGVVDERDLKEIGSEVLEQMMEDGDLDLETYAREFQIEAQEREDYRRISQEILENMDKDWDFLAEYSMRFEKELESQISEYNSKAYDIGRIDSYTLGGLYNKPEEDYRSKNKTDKQEELEKETE